MMKLFLLIFPKPKSLFIRMIFASGVITLLPFIQSWHWILDLGSHFQFQVLVLQIILFSACLIWKSWKPAACSFVILLVGLFHLWPFIGWRHENETPPDHSLRITSLNVLSSNLEHDKVINYLNEQDADIIFLSEVTELWNQAIIKNLPSYPYSITETRKDAFGTLLLSRYPITERHIIRPANFGEPLIRAVLDVKGQPITILGLHPIPPVGGNSSRDTQKYLQHARLLSLATKTPLIVAGDFNATPWGLNYELLVDGTKLTSCAEGENTFTTWNAFKQSWLPFTGLMIDHILYSPDFQKHSFSVTPELGSDHFGLTTELSLINPH